MKKNRVLVLIDGYNYYHKLKEYQDKYNKCVKWLNYRSLVESWLTEEDDKDIYRYMGSLKKRKLKDVKVQKSVLTVPVNRTEKS